MSASSGWGKEFGLARFTCDEHLRKGDEVAGFRSDRNARHTADTSRCSASADRLLIAGDALANVHFFTNKPGLRLPPPNFARTPPRTGNRSFACCARAASFALGTVRRYATWTNSNPLRTLSR